MKYSSGRAFDRFFPNQDRGSTAQLSNLGVTSLRMKNSIPSRVESTASFGLLKPISNPLQLAIAHRQQSLISKMLHSTFAITSEELPKLDAIISEMFAEFASLSGVN